MNKHKKKTEWWWASQIASKLDYKDLNSFSGALNKTIQTFTILDIHLFENIVSEMNGNKRDYKLSRFATYLVVLHADSKKESVNRAKYNIARKTGLSTKTLVELERVGLREELSEANKWLSSIAKKGGVTDYRAFVNAGYIGMYSRVGKGEFHP
jgi:DNA-damage-inducible protein D